MSGEAQLEALLEIINTSARQAIAQYKKDGNEVPTIHSKTFHPIDFGTDTISLKKALRQLEGACQQLCASLSPPQHSFFNFAVPFEWACARVVVRAKVTDALEKYPEGLHVDELAKIVNLEKGKLARVLRLLSTKGCFTEVKPNVFANNRISLVALWSSNTGAHMKMLAEDVSQAAINLYEAMTEPEYATSYHPDRAPFIYALRKKGIEGNYFDLMKKDDERRETFHRAMVGINRSAGSLSVLHQYPWNEVKTICDVGAGVGAVSMPLSKVYPHLEMVNQDLPEVLDRAKDIWAKDAPQALQDNRVEFVPLNFLEESPVRGQDVYYLRNIIHDWPDAEATTILRNVRKAMAPHSRLLIHGMVLTPATRNTDSKSFGVEVAPEPLLPNFGHGSHRTHNQDMVMWFMHNSKERNLDELLALGAAAGLRLEKGYDLADTVVLEFRLDGEPHAGYHSNAVSELTRNE